MKKPEKVVPFVVPPSKKECAFVVYIEQHAGGGVYGWQPYASPMVEGSDPNSLDRRNGAGSVCHLPFEALGLRIEYGDRFMVKVTRMRHDDEIREKGRKAEREYKAKERAHLRRVQRMR
jgi:hypothetical protein